MWAVAGQVRSGRVSSPGDPPLPFPRSLTSTVSQVTVQALRDNPYGTVSTSIGLVAIALLVFVLVVKEIVRARGLPDDIVAAYDVVVVPLVMAAGVIMALRILDVL